MKSLLEITSFFLYLCFNLNKIMNNRKFLIFSFCIFNTILVFSQCEYMLTAYTHNNCYGDNMGSINITLTDPNSLVDWAGPNGFISNSTSLNNLYAGAYYLTVTNSVQLCTLRDSIYIQESNKISADFELMGRCNNQDSVDVITTLRGGTPPYTSVWSNGDIGPNALNLPPANSVPHVLTITDINSCTSDINLLLPNLNAMNSFMSSVGAICKDDNSGEARVLVQGGTPPFIFNWDNQNEIFVSQSNSVISGLFPGIYSVKILDDMGCAIEDSIEVKSNPNICVKAYNAFSPNDDDIHEFWEIENIHLYPQAVVSVYDRNGIQVFSRRNYVNAENVAFGGKDPDNQPLPSGTYYYVINLENGDDVFKGTLTIVR